MNPIIYIHPKSNLNPISVEKFLKESSVYDNENKLISSNCEKFIKQNEDTSNVNIKLKKHSLLKLDSFSNDTPIYYKKIIYNNIRYDEYYLFFIDGKWTKLTINYGENKSFHTDRWYKIQQPFAFYIKNKQIYPVLNEKKYEEVKYYKKWNYNKNDITSQYWFHFSGNWGEYNNQNRYNIFQIPPEYYIYISNNQMIISIIIIIFALLLSLLYFR
jgi:hypothetical protein